MYELLSIVAFKMNLRRYNLVIGDISVTVSNSMLLLLAGSVATLAGGVQTCTSLTLSLLLLLLPSV
jgi:hypothetical protein